MKPSALTFAALLFLAACTTTNVERYGEDGTPQTMINWQGGGDTTRLTFYCPGEGGGVIETEEGKRSASLQGCFMYLETTDASVVAPTVEGIVKGVLGAIP